MQSSIRPLQALTIDIEDYFQVAAFENKIQPSDWSKYPIRVDINTYRILDVFEKNQAKATFFILGWVAEKFPELIRDIHRRGHEVASHGYSHTKATTQTPAQFLQDITSAKHLLEDIIGAEVTGYRAPSFSICAENEWAFASLKEAGYRYSSSTYPIKHDHYGTPYWPAEPYLRKEGLWEFPMPILTIKGRQIPIAGGGYFRLLPYWLSKALIQRYLRQHNSPYMFYFHPWEIDNEQPRIEGASFKSRFRHYVNLKQMECKVSKLLQDFEWSTVQQVFESYQSTEKK
ncbi:MAG: DUF3473 domain-containing protein [Alkalimonas sp.]|nr:DUF3473 domain-containing protein [Alkalimonas sp.]